MTLAGHAIIGKGQIGSGVTASIFLQDPWFIEWFLRHMKASLNSTLIDIQINAGGQDTR